MRLVYLTTFIYPSTYANRLQVLKMSEAFSCVSDFTIVVGGVTGDIKTIFYENSIRREFPVMSLGVMHGRLRMARAVWALRDVVRESALDAVFYAREPLPAFFLSFLSGRFRNNFFFEAHSFSRYPVFIYRRIFSSARGVVATSEKKADAFQHMFRVSKEKMLVRGNGFDADFFRVMPSKKEARNVLHLPHDKRVVTMIGKPTIERDIATFLMAAEKMPEALFLSVGGTSQEIERMRSYKGFSCVRFIERVRPEEVAAYYAASNVIVVLLSSKFPDIAAYASPLKAREALATGVPVIFSDVPALHDVADESFVTFMKPDDADALTTSIRTILGAYSVHQEKANKAREIFLKQSWQNRAEDIVEFMENRKQTKQ